ncbi:hypothetical protein ABZ642_29085 [Streptomyces sp. NPDC007157]|uniref:hypothetical protein n=1 Tax=Streptomyces sp. NPDC007157 TaxID=3154681 RepID=UPI0033F6C1C5
MIRVDFSIPAVFADIPVGADFDTARAEVNRRCARTSAAGDLDTEKPAEMARTLQRVSRLLDEVGVVYAAGCLHSFQGEPSLCSLAVAVAGGTGRQVVGWLPRACDAGVPVSDALPVSSGGSPGRVPEPPRAGLRRVSRRLRHAPVGACLGAWFTGTFKFRSTT